MCPADINTTVARLDGLSSPSQLLHISCLAVAACFDVALRFFGWNWFPLVLAQLAAVSAWPVLLLDLARPCSGAGDGTDLVGAASGIAWASAGLAAAVALTVWSLFNHGFSCGSVVLAGLAKLSAKASDR